MSGSGIQRAVREMVPVWGVSSRIPQPWDGLQKGAMAVWKSREPYYEAILSAIRGRYRLLPYIYSLAGEVWRENGTMMRPLVFDFSEDKKAAGIMDEYMFGPSLWSAP